MDDIVKKYEDRLKDVDENEQEIEFYLMDLKSRYFKESYDVLGIDYEHK